MQVVRKPLISVIMPTLNQGKFIREAIDSVLSQDYPYKELWVIDGGSDDDTVAILKSYGNRIKWISEKDNGQAHAINKGCKNAKGEIIAFLNSDDYYLPDAFNRVADCFANQDVLWVTGDYKIIDENGSEIHKLIHIYKYLLRKYHTQFLLKLANYIVQPSTFWKKTLMERVGGFDENLRYALDYDFWLRIIENYPPGIIQAKLSAFRIHGNSKGGAEFQKQFNEELDVLKKFTKNSLIIWFHHKHNRLIKFVYTKIK